MMGVMAGAKVVSVETVLVASTILRSRLLPRSTTIAKVMSDEITMPCGLVKLADAPTPFPAPDAPVTLPAASEEVTVPPVRLSRRTR